MKKLFTILLIFVFQFANATNYYFSASGSDTNNGTSSSTPWKTIAKFNAVFSSLSPGDNILFNRGDVFYGNIVVNKSGTSGSPITIGAYGTGPNPVITGFTTVPAWTNLGSNIWESTSSVSTLPYTNMVVINGVNTPMGRYPNSSWLNVDSHTSSSITSSGLSGTHTGGELVIKPYVYVIDRVPITSQSGTTLNFSSSAISSPPTDGYGFFIQNESTILNVQNEWYYNPSTKKLRMYSTSSPVNVQVPTIDTLVDLVNRSYIKINGISFIGSNKLTLNINYACTNIIITNCSFDYAGRDAVVTSGGDCNYVTIADCSLNHTNNNGVFLGGGNSTGATVTGNTIKNSGVIPGMGSNGGGTYSAIVTHMDNSTVTGNTIDSCGYSGIEFEGSNMIISQNLIQHFCAAKIDGSAIYSYVGDGSHPHSNQAITYNIILNGLGDIGGTQETAPSSFGIYMDDGAYGITVKNNTVFNAPHSGIYVHNGSNLDIQHNNLFNNGQYQFLAISSEAGFPIRNMTFKNNTLVAKETTQKVMLIMSKTNDLGSFGSIDSNYLARPIDDDTTIQSSINGYDTIRDRTLSGWQSYSGFDAHSLGTPKTITDVNDLRFEYNATSSNKTISLDSNYIDVKNVSYNGTITLASYTSAVLIRNGAIINQLPVANSGVDQTITLPTNSTTLSGNGTDADGTIVGYLWTNLYGSVGTITSPNSATTTVTGLAQGNQAFQLQVTDNSGGTAVDALTVVVNPANVLPVANSGVDQTITLPTNSTTLSGSGTDADGTIAGYLWTNLYGSVGTITSPNSATTTVTGLAQGNQAFQLQVTDNSGGTAVDALTVVVNPDNLSVNTGTDQTSAQVSVRAYPNSFTNYIKINVTGGIRGKYKLMLVDALGKVVWTKSGFKNAGDFQQSINTSTLESGTYFLKVIQNNTISVIKLVK